MNLVFQIRNFQLLIFYINCPELLTNLDYAFLCFFYSIIKVNLVCIIYYIITFNSSFSLTIFLLVLYAYVCIKSTDCILSSSFELYAISLVLLVTTLWLSFLNLCCVWNINLLFLMNSLWFF